MSAFRQPPPIEDLSDLSWKRVEQRLTAKLDAQLETAPPSASPGTPAQPGARWPWVAGVGILAVAAAALVFLGGGEHTSPAGPETAIAENTSEIITQESSTDLLVPGAHLEVSPYSEVAIEQAGDTLTVHLRDGGVRLDVEPRDHRSPLTVLSGDVRIEVVGTEFAVYQSAGKTQVTVFEGLVAVSQSGRRELIKAGERWPTGSADAMPPDMEAVAQDPVPEPATSKARTTSEKTTSVERGTNTRELYEAAAAKELDDPQQALRLYKQASKASGPWAANALYAQARLLLARGDQAKAKVILKRYRSRFPSGANAVDAEALLQEL
jgi:hypothetical protein